jgi:sporulation integral membrane protein YtvI
VTYLTENSDKIAQYFQNVFDFFNSIGEKLPILSQLQNTGFSESIIGNVNDLINNVWKSLLERLGSAVPDVAGAIVMALPSIFLVSLITVVSCFYFAVDIDIVNTGVKKVIPQNVLEHLRRLKNKLAVGLKKYLKAYCILFVMTFFELIIGFAILGVDYAFVLALLISFIDFLPVFGAGAILAPWGLILLLMKNYFLGIGIIVMFVIMTIVRQIVEPKIVGKNLGVHPILTLITIYIGYELFGIFGMVFLPIVALIAFSKDEMEKSKK